MQASFGCGRRRCRRKRSVPRAIARLSGTPAITNQSHHHHQALRRCPLSWKHAKPSPASRGWPLRAVWACLDSSLQQFWLCRIRLRQTDHHARCCSSSGSLALASKQGKQGKQVQQVPTNSRLLWLLWVPELVSSSPHDSRDANLLDDGWLYCTVCTDKGIDCRPVACRQVSIQGRCPVSVCSAAPYHVLPSCCPPPSTLPTPMAKPNTAHSSVTSRGSVWPSICLPGIGSVNP